MADNPDVLMAVSLGLIIACLIVIVLFIIFVHTMPGKIARKAGNPQAEAIEILSLLGLLIFPLWMAALVWAYMRPFSVPIQMIERQERKPTNSKPTASKPTLPAADQADEPEAEV